MNNALPRKENEEMSYTMNRHLGYALDLRDEAHKMLSVDYELSGLIYEAEYAHRRIADCCARKYRKEYPEI